MLYHKLFLRWAIMVIYVDKNFIQSYAGHIRIFFPILFVSIQCMHIPLQWATSENITYFMIQHSFHKNQKRNSNCRLLSSKQLTRNIHCKTTKNLQTRLRDAKFSVYARGSIYEYIIITIAILFRDFLPVHSSLARGVLQFSECAGSFFCFARSTSHFT